MHKMKRSFLLDLEPGSDLYMPESDLYMPGYARLKAELPYVQEIGEFYAREKYYTRREGLESYLMKYTVSGEGVLEYKGTKTTVVPGHFFWIDCREPQYYYTSSHSKHWHVIWVHFEGPGCEYLYKYFTGINRGNIGILHADSDVPQVLNRLLAPYRAAPKAHAEIEAAAGLMAMMSELIISSSAKDKSGSAQYIHLAQEYIRNNFNQSITLDVLAQKLSISKFHLQKLFKRYTGRSPNTFQSELRILHAKELLRTTNRTIVDIAQECGIESAGYFIKLFANYEGKTPATYRKCWNGESKLR
jgi:AraC-like DNA-binding protein